MTHLYHYPDTNSCMIHSTLSVIAKYRETGMAVRPDWNFELTANSIINVGRVDRYVLYICSAAFEAPTLCYRGFYCANGNCAGMSTEGRHVYLVSILKLGLKKIARSTITMVMVWNRQQQFKENSEQSVTSKKTTINTTCPLWGLVVCIFSSRRLCSCTDAGDERCECMLCKYMDLGCSGSPC